MTKNYKYALPYDYINILLSLGMCFVVVLHLIDAHREYSVLPTWTSPFGSGRHFSLSTDDSFCSFRLFLDIYSDNLFHIRDVFCIH